MNHEASLHAAAAAAGRRACHWVEVETRWCSAISVTLWRARSQLASTRPYVELPTDWPRSTRLSMTSDHTTWSTVAINKCRQAAVGHLVGTVPSGPCMFCNTKCHRMENERKGISRYWRRKLENACFPDPTLVWRPRPGGDPSEFLDETYPAKTRGVELLCGKNCMILASTVIDWSTRETDGRTDGRAIAYSALSMLSRAKKPTSSRFGPVHGSLFAGEASFSPQW